MIALHLTRKARRQIADIAAYTIATWGAERADKYRAELNRTLVLLCSNPLVGVDISDIRQGYRSFPSGHHVILYRLKADRLEVVTILHERMDPRRHL